MDRFKRGGAVRHAVAHTFEMIAASTSMIMCGVCGTIDRAKEGWDWRRHLELLLRGMRTPA